MPKINVKWGPKKFELDASTDLEPLVLKSQLYELTGVLPEYQRVIIKGQRLKDQWGNIKLQDGLTIMLIGSATFDVSVVRKSEEAAREAARQKKISETSITSGKEEQFILPVGLRNLGNTCYMNACFQAYKTIPELVKSIESYSGVANNNNRRSHQLILSTKQLYNEIARLEKTNTGDNAYTPLFLLMNMHATFPQFSARDNHGHYQQQDANECFSQVLQILADGTTVKVGDGSAGIQESQDEKTIKTARIFETEFDVTLKCLENEEEPEQKSHESHLQLSCFLNQEVRYVQSGIKSRLIEEIEKHSTTLDRNVKYQKQSQISRLPEYLCVQMVRFFYKQKEQISAKILKDVKFPIKLDVYDVCAPALQEKLKPMRNRYKIFDDHKVEELRISKMDDNTSKVATATTGESAEKKDEKFLSTSFDDDPGSNNSGFYELKAVITHKGRSSDSGHYVAWVRVGDSRWAMCDDDEVHPVSEEEVLKLSGGGDWHCAYLLIYGPRALPAHTPASATTAAVESAVDVSMDTR